MQVAVGGQCIAGDVCTIHTTCPDQRRTVAGNSDAGGHGYGTGLEPVQGNCAQSGRISAVHFPALSLTSQVWGVVGGPPVELVVAVGVAVGTVCGAPIGAEAGVAVGVAATVAVAVAIGPSSGGLCDTGASAP